MKIFYSIGCLILLMMFYSCHSEFEGVNEVYERELVKNDSLSFVKDAVYSMGFDTVSLGLYQNYVVVEGDILIKKDDLFKINGFSRQLRSNYYVKNGSIITVGVDSTIPSTSEWVEVIKEVLSIYNKYTGLVFVYSNSNPMILVKKEAIGNNVSTICAAGDFPSSDGKPASLIRINTKFYEDIDAYLSYSEKVFLIMHELGHNIGLRHTNALINGEGAGVDGAVKIPGTPDTDVESFMNSNTCGYDWYGMSYYDEIALKALWPRYFTLSFNGSRSNISFKEGDSVKIDWRIYSTLANFTGWYYDSALTEECKYGTEIKETTTLYPKYVANGTNVTVSETSTDYANGNKYLELDHGQVVTVTCSVRKALNEWWDISKYENETGGVITSYGRWPYETIHFYLEPYILNNSTEPEFSNTWKVYLPKGSYIYDAFFSASLGEQNSRSDQKHGISKIVISYKE